MDGLRKTYGDKVAVDEISLSVQEGEIFGILGPNGAGKSTTVESIAGLRVGDRGRIRVHGIDPWTDRAAGSLRARMFAANLGVVEDEATGSAAMRITDYLSQSLRITQGKGSIIDTTWSAEGWVGVAGRVVNDGVRQLD